MSKRRIGVVAAALVGLCACGQAPAVPPAASAAPPGSDALAALDLYGAEQASLRVAGSQPADAGSDRVSGAYGFGCGDDKVALEINDQAEGRGVAEGAQARLRQLAREGDCLGLSGARVRIVGRETLAVPLGRFEMVKAELREEGSPDRLYWIPARYLSPPEGGAG